MTHVCLARPGPPNLTMSLQNVHSPQSACLQASHFLHLVRLLLGPAVPALADFRDAFNLLPESPADLWLFFSLPFFQNMNKKPNPEHFYGKKKKKY